MAEMSKIEEVARALCRQEGEAPDLPTPHHPTVKHLWEHYIPSARAAIEAMRKPTVNMSMKGLVQSERDDINLTPEEVDDMWGAMVDAALSEEVAG